MSDTASRETRRVAIPGSGLMGAALGRLWVARGHASRARRETRGG